MEPQHSDRHGRDDGYTVLEVVVSTVVLGILSSSLAFALVIGLRATPSTEQRLDDARATRSLATWLSHDTTSTPPFLPETAQGGIDIDAAANATNNDCGGDGVNLLHLQWTENALVETTFVANYRFVADADEARIVRYRCHLEGSTFSTPTVRTMTTGLDPAVVPEVTVAQAAPGADVTSVTFGLVGASGERVAVETGSRNYADFFS